MIYSAEGINWNGVVEHHRPLLARVVEMLFSMVIGLDEGRTITTLPRSTRNHIYRILRPAESALRRLILIAARDIASSNLPPRGEESENPGLAPAKPLVFARDGAAMPTKGPVYTGPLGLAGVVYRPKEEAPKPVPTRAPVFALIDPRKHFRVGPRRRYARAIPRVTRLDGRDRAPLPAIKLPGPDDPVDATRLCRRLIALKYALENLDKQAQRLARLKARRRLHRSPMRPGYPPGRRKRQAHEIDEILKELHSWALYSEETNTS